MGATVVMENGARLEADLPRQSFSRVQQNAFTGPRMPRCNGANVIDTVIIGASATEFRIRPIMNIDRTQSAVENDKSELD